MTDAELRDAAWAELQQTTLGWDKVGKYPPERFARTHWAKAKGYLDMVGRNVVAPSPVPLPTTAAVTVPRKGVSLGWANANTISGASRRALLDHCQTIGSKVIRIDSTTGNQTQLDTVVDEIIERGMEPLLNLHGTAGVLTAAQAESFATSQGTKWAANGKCRLFEFCNEPDLQGWTPQEYADASWGFVDGLTATHPNPVLMLGALFKWQDDVNGTLSCAEFVRQMLVQGLPNFHYLTVHVYDDVRWTGAANSWRQININSGNNIRDHLNAAGRSSVKIGITEANNPMGPSGPYSEADQGTFPTDFDAKMQAGVVSFMLAYSINDDSLVPGVADGYGLMTLAGSPRTAYTTFTAVAAT